jgi:hypothetical protein
VKNSVVLPVLPLDRHPVRIDKIYNICDVLGPPIMATTQLTNIYKSKIINKYSEGWCIPVLCLETAVVYNRL